MVDLASLGNINIVAAIQIWDFKAVLEKLCALIVKDVRITV